MRETLAVAHAKGVAGRRSIDGRLRRERLQGAPAADETWKSRSRAGRRLELPWLSGAVARIGREVGVPTPIHAFINAVLKPHVDGKD